jgi:acyl-CoA synthetase (AMP-forming)/AMP-acid ligase II
MGIEFKLRTGDLGRLDADGRIYLVDRAKDLIITGGENVYPAEVENVPAALPRTATGKVVKTALREPYWRGHDRRIN